MDKDALGVIAAELAFQGYTPAAANADGASRAVVAALGANGYVVVPRHLLDELLNAAHYKNINLPGGGGPRLSAARAAVVEAVGPTT